MQNRLFHRELTTEYDLKQHPQIHLTHLHGLHVSSFFTVCKHVSSMHVKYMHKLPIPQAQTSNKEKAL